MQRFLIATVATLLAVSSGMPAQGAAMMPIMQKAQTKSYSLLLQIGPEEKMYSEAEAAKTHPTSGEVMVSGTMMSMAGMAMDVRHLEVHVVSRATGKVVTTAKVSITVTDKATRKSTVIPVAAMYGVKEGKSDWHYGNNVSMPPGTYTVRVVVNGERATFALIIPKM